MADPPTDSEKPLIIQFREMFKSELDQERLQSDTYLLRWLRARNHDLEKAALMLRTSLKWREQNKVDLVLGEMIDRSISDLLDVHYSAFDKSGRPLVAVPAGELDVRKALDDGKKPEFLRFAIQALEIFDQTLQMIHKYGYPTRTLIPQTKFSVICDLKGFTYAKLAHKQSVEAMIEMVKIYEANYPESLARCVVINAPRIFSILFALVKPFLGQNTIDKIAIFDTNEKAWKKAVEDIVDVNQLPVRYGGTKLCTSIMD